MIVKAAAKISMITIPTITSSIGDSFTSITRMEPGAITINSKRPLKRCKCVVFDHESECTSTVSFDGDNVNVIVWKKTKHGKLLVEKDIHIDCEATISP